MPEPRTELRWTEDECASFWRQYGERAQPAIERACRALSRVKTDHGMAPEDMMAWSDDRVWALSRKSGWPFFHDAPTPSDAADRVARSAKTLARWAYLGLCRAHWRRTTRDQAIAGEVTRVERLAITRSSSPAIEQNEEVSQRLEAIRARVSGKVLARLSASWPEEGDRRRVAVALGATTPEDESLMQQVEDRDVTRNTVDQMRSRSRRDVRAAMASVTRPASAVIAIIAAVFLVASPVSGAGKGGEQSGGRGGMLVNDGAVADLGPLSSGEQSGGRGGKG